MAAKETVPVVKTKIAAKKYGDESQWKEVEVLAEDIEKLSGEIQAYMEKVSPLIKQMDEKIVLAYQKAPKKDCLLNTSPLGRAKIRHALEAHMFKTGFYIGGVHIGDYKKIVTFKEYVKESLKWLLKFSY